MSKGLRLRDWNIDLVGQQGLIHKVRRESDLSFHFLNRPSFSIPLDRYHVFYLLIPQMEQQTFVLLPFLLLRSPFDHLSGLRPSTDLLFSSPLLESKSLILYSASVEFMSSRLGNWGYRRFEFGVPSPVAYVKAKRKSYRRPHCLPWIPRTWNLLADVLALP